MAITALPPSTVRLLDSSVTIVDPVSLIKELVENSIDAQATTIGVTITQDTISKIQVHDNGSGIHVADFDSLGRRAHTSKIRTFDDLQANGGKTLGFRGEALASVNVMGTVKITTRTADDPVASLLQLKVGEGGVAQRQPVSGKIGTTVQVLKLFEGLPVRKHSASKESTKAVQKIKALLQVYAFARPHLKLSLKVMGSNSWPWSYSPCSTPGIRGAVIQTLGHSLAEQCTQIAEHVGSSQSNDSISLKAFLPKPGCDVKAMKGKGAFISVDSRPISSTRGTGKKIYAIFKTLVTKAEFSSAPHGNPFMQLSIRCCEGSYDPNVSPMKDEILFVDEQRVLAAFERICHQLYQRTASMTNEPSGKADLIEPTRDGNGSDELTSEIELGGSDTCNISEDTGVKPDNSHQQNTTANKPTRCNGATQGPSHVLEPTLIPVMMRTVTAVNLARTMSDQSEEGATAGLIPIKVAPRQPEARQPQPKECIRPKKSTLAHPFEDIGRYFEPIREQPIHIAADETATPGRLQRSSPLTREKPPNINRPPLKELSGSALNKIRAEPETDDFDDASSPELEVWHPQHGPRTNLDEPILRLGPMADPGNTEPAPPIHGHDAIPPLLSSSSAQHSLGRDMTTQAAVPARPSFAPVLQSPPLSSERMPGLNHGLRSSAPRMLEISYGSASSLGDAGSRQAHRSIDQSPLQSRPMRLRGSALHNDRLSASSVYPRIPPRSHDLVDAEPVRVEPSRPSAWSHVTQALLMRTPPPPDEGLTTGDVGESGLLREQLGPPEGRDTSTPCMGMGTSIYGPLVRSDTSTNEEPRIAFKETQPSRPLTGKPEKAMSTRLPLEVTPSGEKMNSVQLILRFRLTDIESSVRYHVKFDADLAGDDAAGALQFRSMDEVDRIDDRLQRVVNEWAANATGLEILYTLRSKVKGKSRVVENTRVSDRCEVMDKACFDDYRERLKEKYGIPGGT